MKRNILCLVAFVSICAMAQSKFGYVSYKEIIRALPEYAIVDIDLDKLQAKYEAEIERSDREFNQKYADFIEQQSGFPENIRIKRHKELQELMEKSIQFKDEVNQAMREARREMMQPLYEKVDKAIMQICTDEGYDYILNTDEKAYIAINPKRGHDITGKLKKALKIE